MVDQRQEMVYCNSLGSLMKSDARYRCEIKFRFAIPKAAVNKKKKKKKNSFIGELDFKLRRN